MKVMAHNSWLLTLIFLTLFVLCALCSTELLAEESSCGASSEANTIPGPLKMCTLNEEHFSQTLGPAPFGIPLSKNTQSAPSTADGGPMCKMSEINLERVIANISRVLFKPHNSNLGESTNQDA